MRHLINIVESVLTVSLLDLYTASELTDETELLGRLGLGSMYWKVKIPVRIMSPEDARECVNARDEPIFDAFTHYATKRQRQLVDRYARDYDHDRIIVLEGDTVIDGNHHLIAAILANQPVRYIDLTDLEEAMKEQFPARRRPPSEEG